MINLYLDTLTDNEVRPQAGQYSLDNMINLLSKFGNPHLKLKFIHVAGTNGKGSVCMMLASIFKTAGYKTGLYTSPHLLKINERIKINNIDISDEDFNYYLKLIENKVREINVRPTFFDVLTLISILYFADNKIDAAVMETGLGGRLDSTNVIIPLCSIITDISYDHENILGHSIEKITAEKCGIIKKNVPVITTNTDPEIVSIINQFCKNNNSDFFLYGKDFKGENPEFFPERIVYRYSDNKTNHEINSIVINHPGNFQIKNSAVSIFLIHLLNANFKSASDAIIADSLKNMEFYGRFQKLSSIPLIYFDPAHNLEAVKNIVSVIIQKWPLCKIYIVYSLMADKNVDSITECLLLNFTNLIYYVLDDTRAFLPDEKWKKKTGITIIHQKSELEEYIACKKTNDSLFFFLGSFRLYSTAIEITEKLNQNEQ
jgi:dihydrofolate synthase/folylpolyglutamate synthase